jgi:hypothetical protein
VSAADLAIMRRLDRLHLEFPFAGSRMLRGLLAAEPFDWLRLQEPSWAKTSSIQLKPGKASGDWKSRLRASETTLNFN